MSHVSDFFKRGRSSSPDVSAFQDDTTGFTGWRINIKRGRAVPTPAIGGGRVFVGGGFGSYDFYAFDAKSGSLAWHLPTTDDGPTAAVIAEDYVIFNTESCTLEVVETKTGKVAWEKWLGDPLLAQPAVMNGQIFMVYPKTNHHWLGAFSLRDGAPLWQTKLDHDVITAPIVSDGKVYLSTFDGTVWCIDPKTGHVLWSQQLHATSAPWIYEGDVYVAHHDKEAPGAKQAGDPNRTHAGADDAADMPRERISRHDGALGTRKYSSPSKLAAYLSKSSGSARKASYHMTDSSVGFAHSPGSAKMHVAEAMIGEGLISRAWRFQGSRPVVVNGILYETAGDKLDASDARTGELLWSWHEAKHIEGERRLTPPAVAHGRVWAGTWDGRVVSWDALTGEVRWAVNVGAPCHWQPVVHEGCVYAGLEDGTLVAFCTGDSLDTDWPMWGGGCGHNGNCVGQSPPRHAQRMPADSSTEGMMVALSQ